MEAFLEILKELNIAQICIIFAGMWFFYNRLDNKIDKVEKSLKDTEDRLTHRIDNLYSLFTGFLCNKKDDKAA